MAFIQTPDGTELFYNDWGSGPPVVLIHGWLSDADMWSDQAVFLADQGYRVIAYDRRGFGRSSQPWGGYDYDTLAADLAAVIDQLDLANAALVGFSMAGGEVARYLGKYGTARITKAALIAAVTPYLLKTEDNPAGVDQSVFDGIAGGISQDRPAFLAAFFENFFGNSPPEQKVSAEIVQWSRQVAMLASLRATLACARAFSSTDFRPDLAAFTIPTLIIHGTADRIVPIDLCSRRAAAMIKGSTLIEYEGEPHGLFASAKDRLSQDLLEFLGG